MSRSSCSPMTGYPPGMAICILAELPVLACFECNHVPERGKQLLLQRRPHGMIVENLTRAVQDVLP